MKKYETPKILVLKIDGDVIKTSGNGGDVHENDSGCESCNQYLAKGVIEFVGKQKSACGNERRS